MDKHLRFRYLGLALMLIASVALSSCGPTTPPVVDLEVDMTDSKFNPDGWEIPAGATVNLTLTNSGTLPHEFVIMKLGTEATVPFDDDDEPNVWQEWEAEPGETVEVTFTAPTEPGDYQVVCGEDAHLELGMIGTLIITR